MAKSMQTMHTSERAGCVQCGVFIEDGTVNEIDQWIIMDDGVLICPTCQLEARAYG